MTKLFDCGHLATVPVRGATSRAVNLVQGTYHGPPYKLKDLIIEVTRQIVRETWQWFDDAMKNQRKKTRN